MSRRNGFPEVTRLYTREIFRLRYSRRARATERAPRSILHRVHKRFLYVLCDWLTPRQSKGSISPFQRPGPGKAVRLLLNGLCFRGASTMTRHLRPYIAATLTNSPPSPQGWGGFRLKLSPAAVCLTVLPVSQNRWPEQPGALAPSVRCTPSDVLCRGSPCWRRSALSCGSADGIYTRFPFNLGCWTFPSSAFARSHPSEADRLRYCMR